jgi:transposase
MQGKVLPGQSAGARVYVGIDVCKEWLDVFIHPIGHKLRVANTREGLRRLKRVLAPFEVVLIVIEATAKLHRLAWRHLHAGGHRVAVVNPLRSRLFAEATGMLAKTDPLDAKVLAVFAESIEPEARAPAPQLLDQLQELVRARQAAAVEAAALSNRHGASQVTFLKSELRRRIKSCKAHLARLEDEIHRRLRSDPALERRYTILLSVPGIGHVVAAVLVVGLAELGTCSGKAVSLLAGLAPIACDSGDKQGRRHIKGGRGFVRHALYMAALTAISHNKDLAAFYKRLTTKHEAKYALTAVMRKLVVLANTLLKEDRTWQPIRP